MLSNLLVVAAQVGTLFLMMAVGFTLAKLNRLTKEAVPQLSFLLPYVSVRKHKVICINLCSRNRYGISVTRIAEYIVCPPVCNKMCIRDRCRRLFRLHCLKLSVMILI